MKYGAGYVDYDLFEMYNLTPQQRDTYLTRGRNNALVVKYNDKAYTGQFDDKVQFNTLFGKYLHRDWVPVTGDNREQVMAFLAAHEVFMAKPSQGSCGWGIEKLRRADYPSLDALYDYLVQRAPKLELEEVLEQHPQVSAIYPGSINTVRMVTIRGKHGKVYLVTAMFRIGNGKFVDNFNSGGMVAPMDPERGVVIDRALDKAKNLYENHPATGTPIKRRWIWSPRPPRSFPRWGMWAGMCASPLTAPVWWRATPSPATTSISCLCTPRTKSASCPGSGRSRPRSSRQRTKKMPRLLKKPRHFL